MMETMEVLGVDAQEEPESDNKPQDSSSPSPSQSGSKINVASNNPIYPAIMPAPQSPTGAAEMNTSSQPTSPPQKSGSQMSSSANVSTSETTSPIEKSQKKRKGLTPEQRERLQAIQQEQEKIRMERVEMLSEKLLQKVSVWVETDRSQTVTEAFNKKMQVC